MSNSVLHILNGDATLALFKKAKISGEVMVWRETLVTGPLFYQLDSELFWEMRSQFMEEAYQAKLGEYKRKVISEFAKLRRFKWKEIVLWYEYDLFCQVNFIALMSYILKNKKGLTISSVCVGDYPGYSRRVGLGELPHTDYASLFKNRIPLRKQELLEADRVWMAFCGKQVHKIDGIESDHLLYLNDALEASDLLFRREKKYSDLEQIIHDKLQDPKISERDLIRFLLENYRSLGFGDQTFMYLVKQVKRTIQ